MSLDDDMARLQSEHARLMQADLPPTMREIIHVLERIEQHLIRIENILRRPGFGGQP